MRTHHHQDRAYTFVFFLLILIAFVTLIGIYATACDGPTAEDEIDSHEADPYDDGSGDEQSYVDVCQVRVIFNYDRQMVAFMSNNDTNTLIFVWRINNEGDREGVVVSNILFSYSEDTEGASFHRGDLVEVVVYTATLDVLYDLFERLIEDSELPDEDNFVCSQEYLEL